MELTSARRDVLRAGGALATLALLGRQGITGSRASTPPRADVVPDGATGVVHADVDGLRSDRALRDDLDTLAGDAAGRSDRAASVPAALDDLRDRIGLDPREVAEAVAFVDLGGDDRSVGVRLWTDWPESAVTDQLPAESERRTYRDTTVHDVGDRSVALLGDGGYAVGTTGAVEDLLDVRAEEAPALDGDVRTAYAATRTGHVRLGFDAPASESLSVESELLAQAVEGADDGHASLHDTAAGTGVELAVEATDADAAEIVRTQADAALALGRGVVDRVQRRTALRDRMRDLLDATDVTREGTTVTVRNDDAGAFALLALGSAVDLFASPFESQGPAAPDAAFAFDYDADDRTLAVAHDAGDAVRAGRLFVRGSGLEATGGWTDIGGSASGERDGDPAVVADDRLRLGAAPDCQVSVVWEVETEDGDGSRSVTLAEFAGPAA